MSLTRRSLLRSTGAVGAAAAAGAVAPKVFRSPVAAQDTVKLSVWKAPHSTDDQKFFDDKLAAYANEHPGVEIEYRVTPWETWQETYTAAFAGSDPPDISYMVNSFFPKFADADALVPLSAIEGANIAEDWEPLYDPAIWGLGARNGEAYGLPFLQSGISLVWNKKLFTEAGLDPDTPPTTWDELIDFAKKLTKEDGSQWGYSIMDNTTGEMLNFVPVPIVNYGGPLATDDDTQWLAEGPEYEKGLQLQIDMIQTDKTAPPLGTFVGHDIDKAFLDGKIAMQLSYASFLQPLLGDYPDFEMGVAMPPAGPLNDLSLGGVGYWMMAKATEKQDVTWDLMQYLSSADIVTEYAQLVKLFPCRTDVNPFEGDALSEAFGATQKNYMRLPALPFDYWTIVMPEIEASLNGQESASDALTVSAQRINDRIAEGS